MTFWLVKPYGPTPWQLGHYLLQITGSARLNNLPKTGLSALIALFNEYLGEVIVFAKN
jgi:hypothetical protein